jgi:dolichol-phosphate mannosyltransferase
MRTLTVVCPVYNEREVIADFHAELRRVLDGLAGWQASILFVVDRSPDGTMDVLRDIARRDPKARVLALSAHFGQQAALLAGLDHCDADAVLMMDSDLQHPPACIPALLAEHERGYDIVHTVREDTPDIPRLKRLSARWFYRILNALSDVPIKENTPDFRLVSRRVVEVFRGQIRERNQFLRGLFVWVGFPSVTVSFRAARRRAGRSKYSFRRMLRFGVDGIVSFSKRPLQAAVFLGIAIGALGFLHAGVTLARFLLYRSLPSGWTTLTILVSIFSGAQLVFLGILGEYLGAVFDEVKARPHYIVEERLNLPWPPPREAGPGPERVTDAGPGAAAVSGVARDALHAGDRSRLS